MTAETNQNQANSAQETQKDNSKEVNMRQIARQLEEERNARLQLQEELKREREERANKRFREEDEDDRSDEPYVDRKSLKKELSRFASDFEKKVDSKAEEKARSMIEQERQQTFLRANPDFKEILDLDNIKKFAEKHPDIAEPMLEMPDNFARQKLLYQNIKLSGVHKPPVPQQTIQQKIDANRRSPYYQPSGGNTPPYSSAGDYSEGGQKNAYQKMQELIKGRRAV
jgi:hypothetical protein